MAHFLRGYDYEPEYTAEEVESRSKAAVSVCVAGEPASDVATWCQCACCRPMPSWEECVCCRSSDLTMWKIKELKCITADRRMQTVVLNEDVLAVMYVQMMRDTGKQGLAPDTLDDKYVVVSLLSYCFQIVVSLKGFVKICIMGQNKDEIR